jgi:transposase
MMLTLPDPRSLSPETLELLRLLVVRAVVALGMSQVDASTYYGVSPHTISQWVTSYRKQGVGSLDVKPQGRPLGAGRVLSQDQEQEIRRLVVGSTPQEQQIASATWTRQAVAELIASHFGIELTLQGVGKYLRRWGLTPQKPARQAREQDPEEVREFVEQTLPEVQDQAEAEGAQLHFIDEVGVKAQDQIGTSYAPQGETPLLEVPKTHIEQDVISSVTPDGDLFYWRFPGTMTAPRFIDFLEHLVGEASTKLIVFADRHPAHEAKAVEQWLEGRESAIELHWVPRYAPECNPDEFLNNDLKQELENEPMPESTSALRDTIGRILDRIAGMSDRIRGYFKQADIDFALP